LEFDASAGRWDNKKSRIIPRHVQLAVRNDEELNKLLAGVKRGAETDGSNGAPKRGSFGYSGGVVAVCNTRNCSRVTWNKRPGEQCCRSCKKTEGSSHGPCCEATAAGSSADSKKRKCEKERKKNAASPAAKNPRVDKALAAASSPSQPPLKSLHGPTSRPEIFYHGTCLKAAMDIQKNGFDVRKSGSNAWGKSLGKGLYVTTTLEKALNYAKRMPCKGAIFELRVQLGQCYSVTDKNDRNKAKWQDMGYDSAWAAEGIIAKIEENCIKDPRHPRVLIQNIALGHTREANRAGYWVDQGKLYWVDQGKF